MRLKFDHGGMSAALCADLGMTREQYTLSLFPSLLAGMVPCCAEAVARPAGTLFPVPCRDVAHEGQPTRSWGERAR